MSKESIQKRARKLLSDLCLLPIRKGQDAEIALIVAALTPPDGWVLMPAVLPEPMLDVLWRAESDMKDADMQSLWAELIAARPEVA